MKYQSRQWSKAVYRNVSKHSSIKITAVSQGILSKNFLGISWCLFSEILYSAELRKNRKTSCDQAAVVRPRSCSGDENTSRRQAHEPAGHCTALIVDCWSRHIAKDQSHIHQWSNCLSTNQTNLLHCISNLWFVDTCIVSVCDQEGWWLLWLGGCWWLHCWHTLPHSSCRDTPPVISFPATQPLVLQKVPSEGS